MKPNWNKYLIELVLVLAVVFGGYLTDYMLPEYHYLLVCFVGVICAALVIVMEVFED